MKFEITDQAFYRTVIFTVEDENKKEYTIRLAEHDWFDTWEVEDSEGNILSEGTQLYNELVTMCEEELAK